MFEQLHWSRFPALDMYCCSFSVIPTNMRLWAHTSDLCSLNWTTKSVAVVETSSTFSTSRNMSLLLAKVRSASSISQLLNYLERFWLHFSNEGSIWALKHFSVMLYFLQWQNRWLWTCSYIVRVDGPSFSVRLQCLCGVSALCELPRGIISSYAHTEH